MKKHHYLLFLTLTLVLNCPQVQGQTPQAKEDLLIPCQEGNLRGYCKADGQKVIAPKYDRAYLFQDGLAVVMLNRKYGFIDQSGREVIPLKYDYASEFYGDSVEVSIVNKYGRIDKNGRGKLKAISRADLLKAFFHFIKNH